VAEVVVLLDGNVVGTIFGATACGSPGQSVGPWGGDQVYVQQDGVYTVVARVKNVGDGAVASQVWLDAVAARTPRAAYCAASGTTMSSGSAITPGAFLELRPGQPAMDAHYTRATIARFVRCNGLTCDAAPAGYVQKGLAYDAQHAPDGLYPYFAAAWSRDRGVPPAGGTPPLASGTQIGVHSTSTSAACTRS